MADEEDVRPETVRRSSVASNTSAKSDTSRRKSSLRNSITSLVKSFRKTSSAANLNKESTLEEVQVVEEDDGFVMAPVEEVDVENEADHEVNEDEHEIEIGNENEQDVEADERASVPVEKPEGGIVGLLSGMYRAVVGGQPTSPPRTRSPTTTEDRAASTIVNINVGGQLFSTSLTTLLNGNSVVLREMFLHVNDDDAEPLPRDGQGNVFIDHDPRNFSTILNFLRANTPTTLPEVGSREWSELRLDADYFQVTELARQMDELLAAEQRRLQEERAAEEAAKNKKKNRRRSSTTDLLQKQGRELERMRVELHRLQFEKAKAEAEGHFYGVKMSYAYNLMVVGVTGTGKSSSLNTILDQQVCEVSGSQAQGTRGCTLRDGVIDDKHFVSYLDTQGLGADTSVSDEELLESFLLAAESLRQMGVVNNILISFDLQTRSTPAATANQLTLCELFAELRRSCFCVFTKWNTNSVLSEWNLPLKKWIRKYRRVKSIDKIKEDPPSYEEMYRCYCQYLLKSLSNKDDGGAFAKAATFLCFFESRIIWSFNLDPVQIEDKEDGELEPYIDYLYTFYRKRALITLKRGSTMIQTDELPFLKSSQDTMADVASRLIKYRDRKIEDLEEMGASPEKRKHLRAIFSDMYQKAAVNIDKKIYDTADEPTREILKLLEGPNRKAPPPVGCAVS